ncbi:MAG TPA: DUF3108 domain-containing protein [Gemmatimonadales bacterium]|nr:DUF3108 domain-containing protein [Gemmatimonadales bacterium]
MIYVCIPVYNEAKTAGLVLWKVRQVFTAFQREYQLLVCDDGSTDGTTEVLSRYGRVLPMTVVTNTERQGYAKSLEALLRLALQRSDRPKRDCAITLHADFVHSPDSMEEMVKRIESGADLVVAEQIGRAKGATSRTMRWVRRMAPRLLQVPGVKDSVSGFLCLRLIALRQAFREHGEEALLTTDGWVANAELLARLIPQARRVETVGVTARYDLHARPSRVRPWSALVAAWKARPIVRAARTVSAALMLMALSLHLTLAGQGDSTGSAKSADSTKPADSMKSASALLGPGAAVPTPGEPAPPDAVPFPMGEHLRYQAKFGIFSVGEATLDVVGRDTVRGEDAVHFRFHIHGGALWYHLDQTMESWVGRTDFRSRRFIQDTEERGKKRFKRYDIFPDSGYYREDEQDSTRATVADPLDDMAFIYWVRTVPLVVGHRYEYTRYFRPDRNPVIVQVIKKEEIEVADHKFQAIVIKPIIPKGRGILAEDADARMWLSDDDRRLLLKLQSNFSFGTITMNLKEFSAPAPPPHLSPPPADSK